ncbi:uncharacterized protein DUF898 [Roseiarcus fermentans]|uniref:Uncharacterized protein DUF898 n=1 Tax=Roseiarcus fermentans TaxID=1473586 RepID=A0A366F1W9_9HYPH|nr:DUF898 family protein [Roseiarcus fermentans]RBP08594.1 uncharacterized protein DUF898 [Roseiarcus fermentans]
MSALTSSETLDGVSAPKFESDARSFFWFAAKGGLLEIVTVGFYRFWLLTGIRRRIWSATSLEGDALEYTGRPLEILIGYLIALAILAPLFLASFLVGLLAETAGFPDDLAWAAAWAAGAASFGFIYLLLQYASYRARRYRVSRTVWRGVRFWMKPAGWRYAFLSVGLMIVVILTLGLAHPWRAAALERFKWRRTFYGDLPARFEATGWAFFKAGVGLWVLATLAVLLPIGLLADAAATRNESLLPFAFLVAALAVPVLFWVWAVFQALEWRWFMNGLRIGGAGFACTLKGWRVVRIYLGYVGVALAISLASSIAGVAIHAAIASPPSPTAKGAGDAVWIASSAASALAYLAVLALIGAAHRTYLVHQFWRAVVDSTSVANAETLRLARRAGQASDAIGEGMLDTGLLDGFDLGAGF